MQEAHTSPSTSQAVNMCPTNTSLMALALGASCFTAALAQRTLQSSWPNQMTSPVTGLGTFYEAIGLPISACGVPPEKLVDDNGNTLPFVALNTNSMFGSGEHCGRWVKISVGNNCLHGHNSQWSVCEGGSALLLSVHAPTLCSLQA